MKMTKKVLVLIMACIVGGATFTGCSQKTDTSAIKQNKITADANEIYTTITDGVDITSMSTSADDALLADSYGIDTSLLESYHVEMGTNRAMVSEIAVFKLKDTKDLDTVKAAIEKRQADLDKQWDRYFDEHEIVKDSRTVVKDNVVLYVVSDQADAIVEKFNAVK